ncbi:hypothetical protein ALO79_200149 [Pseudomonas syringae pv. castaneae]|uniref:Uncharacterized protein n=1 Tax=Pseudomonas syringae pv. castaneae TaxID=264450 RepID=A0A0P9N5C2_PSESX|nr:hypothetical protein ALO79_200149 [Pseudomonas syringae pv. castaneae]
MVPGCQVQTRQQLADLGAMLRIGLFDMLASQARLQQRRFAGQLPERNTVGGAQRIRHRQIGLMQYVQQFDEERHFLHRAAFDQGQDEFTLLQTDKEIGVFAAGGDPLEIKQAAEPVRGKKGFQLGPSQGGEHRHG